MKDNQRVVRGVWDYEYQHATPVTSETVEVPHGSPVAILPINPATGAVGPVEKWMGRVSLNPGEHDRLMDEYLETDSELEFGGWLNTLRIAALNSILGGQDDG